MKTVLMMMPGCSGNQKPTIQLPGAAAFVAMIKVA